MNRIRVEQCWSGGDKFSFRLTFPAGSRESVRGDTWTRAVAAEALDIAEHLYGMSRSRVRFVHV